MGLWGRRKRASAVPKRKTERAFKEAMREAMREQPLDVMAFVGDFLKTRASEAESQRAPGSWSRPPGIVHKATFSVRDPEQSVAFVERYLGATRIRVPDPTLEARGIKWVRLLGGASGVPATELHFVPWDQDGDTGRRGGIDINGDGVVDESECDALHTTHVPACRRPRS